MNFAKPTDMVLRGRLADTVLLTYRTPADSVREMLPDGLELVQRGPWAFWSVVCCRVEQMRPIGVPAALGVGLHHVAYRLRVQAMTASAEVIDGLYFTHSDADAPLPPLFGAVGNRLTDLRLHRAEIAMNCGDDAMCVTVDPAASEAGYGLRLDLAHAPAARLEGSCFPTVEDARSFGRYPRAALSVHPSKGDPERRTLHVMRVERVDSSWCETPVAVRDARLGYLDAIGQGGQAELEWAVRLRPMEYRWVLGERHALLDRCDTARRWTGVA
ncbi:DUF2071 domain-containing protein [Phycisphaeraceae bacterium D3-23]